MTEAPLRLPRRYRWARLLHLAGLLYLSLAGWARMILALRDGDLLREYQARPDPLYLVIGGAAWGLLALALAALLYVRRPWARFGVFAGGLALALSYWLDRLLFIRAAPEQANWPYALLLTLLLLIFSASLMYLLWNWEKEDGRKHRPGS
jgi:hypothetical protein